ncbi:lytic transglycosylase domain-containing protein [Acetobacteraceae bacterium KSS8]|uniref:Lytic transglycosylase domain-containing protein n=1 Tax=Endosaccharibacter trunci TaxID=2812733 RepID=A0ABT1W9T6_9PROT|nr:lytic transglycosylase domain-containing protein [Acetobacteraceae bacterium KSS8]
MTGFLRRGSPLPPLVAKAFLAGAALLAGHAHAEPRPQPKAGSTKTVPSEEVAMAAVRLSHATSGTDTIIALPHPLNAADAARLRRIFALQRVGNIAEADHEIAQLQDTSLLGDILAERYLAPGAHTPPDRLAAWLRSFSDLPDAPAIYRLLASTSPHGTRLGPPPSPATLDTESPTDPAPDEMDPVAAVIRRNALLDRTIQARLDSGPKGADRALALVGKTPHLDPLYAAQLRSEIALRLFSDGSDVRAFDVGRAAFEQSGRRIGLAGFVAGLSAWRRGHPEQAAPLFEAASRAALAAPGLRAGAAFWAARAHRRMGDARAYRPWLERAAAAPRTFYGLIAGHLLGRDPFRLNDDAPDSQTASDAAWSALPHNPSHLPVAFFPGRPDAGPTQPGTPVLTEVDLDAVGATPAGRRVFALLQIGEDARAEATLRRLWPGVQDDMAMCRSIQLVADAAHMTALSAQLAAILQARDGHLRDQAQFPMPNLAPRHGFTVNPALVYALARIESNFDPRATSGAGASGLMQLMPQTAGFVSGNPSRFSDNAGALHDAGLNLDLGQRYLSYLAHASGVHDDLIRLLASYNAGPNAILRWDGDGESERDPLLYMESLRLGETRDYVHRSLAYLWIYAARMHLPSPSLAAIAAGNWPSFSAEAAIRRASVH